MARDVRLYPDPEVNETFELRVDRSVPWASICPGSSTSVMNAKSTLVANVAVQRKEWYKALFNVSQSVVTMGTAGLVYAAVGGHPLIPSLASTVTVLW